jgi:energy-converting hydrogenase B subunit D
MIPLQVTAFVLAGLGAAAVVLVRDPLRQLVANGLYGLVLSSLFVILQAPDVALSMLVVGSIAYPLIVLIAVARVRSREREGAGG